MAMEMKWDKLAYYYNIIYRIVIVWTLLFLTQQSLKGRQKPGLGEIEVEYGGRIPRKI